MERNSVCKIITIPATISINVPCERRSLRQLWQELEPGYKKLLKTSVLILVWAAVLAMLIG